MTDHNELVEKVARALDTWVDPERIRTAIALIRAEALEEAALVVNGLFSKTSYTSDWQATRDMALLDAAAAIRALKDKQ